MSPRPQRFLLSDQVVEILREGISQGRWVRELPGEMELCREFQVSRVTLRKALSQLIREGWIASCGRGCHHRIRRLFTTRATPDGKIIRLLTPYSLAEMGAVHHELCETLSERVGALGYRTEVEHHPRVFNQFQPSALARLNALPDTAGWVLFFATEEMQRWFANASRPCVAIGRVYEGVGLSNVYPDTQAMARHAAGILHSRGHNRLVCLIANFTSLGDRLASEAFAEEAMRLGANARVITHPARTRSLRRTLDTLLKIHPRPTAFFSTCPEHCLTTLCHLLNAGVRLPSDASVIAGWYDLCLSHAVPAISHYRIDGQKAGRTAASLLLDLLKHGRGKIRAVRMVPDFVAAETLERRNDEGSVRARLAESVQMQALVANSPFWQM